MYSTAILFYEKKLCISFLSCFGTISNYNRAGDLLCTGYGFRVCSRMFCYQYLSNNSGHPMLWWLCVAFQTLAWNAQCRVNQIHADKLRFWTDQRVSKWMNEWTNERTNQWLDGWMDGWTNERTNEQMDGWMNELMNEDGRMDEWMNEWFSIFLNSDSSIKRYSNLTIAFA